MSNFNQVRDQLIMEMNKQQKIKDEATVAIDKTKSELNEMLFDKASEEGVTHLELGNGYKLSCTKGNNYKLKSYKTNVELKDAVEDMLDKLDEDIGELCISWTPVLDKKNYLKLSDENKKIIDTVLEIKPKKTALKFVEPSKGKK